MTQTRIKICGITNASDAVLAASLGADYIGVIFADSPRRVDVSRAREIRDAVPGVSVVGVFRNQALEEVVDITRTSGIDLVQLHGDESPEFCNEVQKQTNKPVIKGFCADRMPGKMNSPSTPRRRISSSICSAARASRAKTSSGCGARCRARGARASACSWPAPSIRPT